MSHQTETDRPTGSLVSMNEEAIKLEQLILSDAEANDGEVSAALESILTEITTEIERKVDTYEYVMARMEESEKMFSYRAERYSRAALAMDTARQRMKDRIKEAMRQRGVNELLGQEWRFKLVPTKGRLLVDPTKLPHHFNLVRTVTEPDKERIRKVLDSGETITGAEIQPGWQLRSYINKGNL